MRDTGWLRVAVLLLIHIASIRVAGAAAPVVYSQRAHESPVRGEPGDLMMLPGIGFAADDVVVYQALDDTTELPMAPVAIPVDSNADAGIAPVVSTANVPLSLTIRLPDVMQAGRSYALWVRNVQGESSNGIAINDARPFWITPSFVYASSAVASLPRYLKVVGRNLQAAQGAVTRVKLSGPATIILDAVDDASIDTAIEHYAARVSLPASLAVGNYSVSVSRDGSSWMPVAGQLLTVRGNPMTMGEFPVSTYGDCAANDDVDDVPCILAAIEAARAAGGGTVLFPAGVWNLTDSTAAGFDGILVPVGVQLRGAGTSLTSIVLSADWNAGAGKPAFTLQGRNRVEGLTFKDLRVYQPADTGKAVLQLGKTFYTTNANDPEDPKLVDEVVITGNVFDKPYIAIGDGGLPIKRLFVTYNEIGAYFRGLSPGGNRYNTLYKFRVEDSVIAYNTFKPGSYLDVSIGQGAMASVIGASYRLDFSDNTADGSSTDYLYSSSDARGWRAGFFWHLTGSQELMLVSQNTAVCTGDKAGDGEAIAYDNNINAFGFPSARTVIDASADTVTVQGTLISRQSNQAVNVASYYTGHWIQIAEGPGVGQVRRIVSYVIDAASSQVTFTVSPAWDVPPVNGESRLAVGREYWQVYTVDNTIDHRQPLCLKSNRTRPKGGGIVLWAQIADSAVEGNKQFDTDGILLHQSYSAPDPQCPTCVTWTLFQYFMDVRGNTVDGEYDWSSDCSQAGILNYHSASPSPSSPPPVAGYGISIAHNWINHADGLRGGAITIPLSWHQGPPPNNWKVVNNTLMHHNLISDVSGAAPAQSCDDPQSGRVGINLHRAGLVWNSVLYSNTCNHVSTPLVDTGNSTVRVCPSAELESCECAN